MITKNYYTNESTHVARSQEVFNDLGYSLDIPWNAVYNTGWQFAKPHHAGGTMWGYERTMITRPDPEFYAPDGIVRSNIIPEINIHDPIYHFDRSKYTYKI